MKSRIYKLPWPPATGNRMWRKNGRRVFINPAVNEFYNHVAALVASMDYGPSLNGMVEIAMDFYPPDRRKRDGDNLQKVIWDALRKAGAVHDDSQFKEWSGAFWEVRRGGEVHVKLTELP